MTSSSSSSKLYSDDISLIIVLLDLNPFFWSTSTNLPFAKFLNQVIPFLKSLLILNPMNQVVVIATGINSCGFVYDSSDSGFGEMVGRLEEFLCRDRKRSCSLIVLESCLSSLLSGSLSLALCCILL